MVRLKDIAARAGVSVMTVSKVLRDAPDISISTKTRVKLIAQQMGYVPDSIAQGLRTRTTKLIGLVVPAVTNPVFGPAIVAIEEQAHAMGYQVLLAHSMNDPAREDLVIRRLLSRRVDGFIICPVYRLAPAAAVYDDLAESGTPVVLLGHKAPFCSQFPSVESDDIQGGCDAAQHLLQLGHRRIAFFAGSTVSPWSQERLEGYKRALRHAGREVDESLIFNAGTSIQDGEKAALQMLGEGARVTAIQACNDLVAIGAARVLAGQGVRIPGDVSLVGFGNFLISEHFQPPLTTIRQPKYRLGAAAMETMRKMLRREPVDNHRLPADLIVRASTAPPPQV